MAKVEKCFGILPLKKEGENLIVLLAHHAQGSFWAFPKGHLNPKETPKEGAKRELFEETNLIVSSFLNVPSIKEEYQFEREGEQIHKYVEYFPAYVQGDLLIKEPKEILELKWFSVQDAINQITFEQSRELLKKVIAIFSKRNA